MVSKSETLYIFNSDLCRSVYITSDGSESVVAGVTTYRFRPPPSVFADPQQNADNKGFCTPENNCLRAGVLNVTSCRGTCALSDTDTHTNRHVERCVTDRQTDISKRCISAHVVYLAICVEWAKDHFGFG